MDGNKDEAVRCVRIGKEALDSGDAARALKFFTKAHRLCPSLAIDDLLSSSRASEVRSSDDAAYASPRQFDAGGNKPDKTGEPLSASFSSAALRKRVRSSAASENVSEKAYTEEQITVVRQIKKKKDYYEILDLERSCTVEDVRKAYRKLSLKVHPDKNNAPGAEEAFKAVSRSFQCLSNEDSRRRYDISGSDDPVPLTRHQRAHAHGFNGFYDGEIDPDEIFRNFFGGNPATNSFGSFQFRTGGGNGGQGMQGSGSLNIGVLIQILPIIILLLFSLLPSSDPPYAFSRSYQYDRKFLTSNGAPFYVKSAKFEEDFPHRSSERVALEMRIEREYAGLLAQNCRLELQRQQWGFQHQKPHCDMLQKFREGNTT